MLEIGTPGGPPKQHYILRGANNIDEKSGRKKRNI